MKTTLSCVLVLLLVTVTGSLLSAQDSDSRSKSDTRNVTGCLTQGDNAKEFLLTTDDGSTWEVRSDSVPLAEHVGHTVSVTGAVSNATAHNLKEDAKEAAHDADMKKDTAEHGHLTVTDLKMVSEACKK